MADSGFSLLQCGLLVSDLLSAAMLYIALREVRKLKELKQALPLESVSAAKKIGHCLPVLVAARGVVNSDRPTIAGTSSPRAVTLEERLDMLGGRGESVCIAESKLSKHNPHSKEWFISDDGGKSRLWVESAFKVDRPEEAALSGKRSQKAQSSGKLKGMLRSGSKLEASWESGRNLKSLPVGTAVTVVGELAKSKNSDRDGMVIRPASEAFSGRPFYITRKSFEELRQSITLNSNFFGAVGCGFWALGVVLVGVEIFRDVRSILQRRWSRRRAAEQERRRHLAQEMNLSAAQAEQEHSPELEEGKCVICWDRQADAIFLPCGHFCACLRCSIELDRCPICRRRGGVQRAYAV